MAKNRFEQVDEPQEDAITLVLERGEDGPLASIACPAAVSGGRLPQDMKSPPMPAKDGFRAAVKLANEVRAAIVVIDPEGLWDAEWGSLYRPVD